MKARRGVLMRTIPVRLLNVSSTGFLIESHHKVDAGTRGLLDVDTGSVRYLSPASLLRTMFRPGAGQTYLIGGMFTPSAAATRHPAVLIPKRSGPTRAARRRPAHRPHTSAA